jgi:protein involved in polysaccharide export with SLBB domain
VGKPGVLPLVNNLTAVQAVVEAGGLKDTSSGDQVVVVRDINTGAPKTETLNLQEVIERKRPDAVLEPSDLVYVQKSYLNVYVGGEVAKPGMIPVSGDMTMMSAIIQAGGFKGSAKTDSVVLVRDNGKGGPIITKVKLSDVFLSSAHTKLKPYDLIFVPKTRIAKIDKWVDEYLRQLSPAVLTFGFTYLFGQKYVTTP